jgi:RNA polymerase sigma-70 factor (ECF subfamily)
LDESELHEFVHMHYPRLVGALALLCGSRATAEDAVQEALARAWERSLRGEEVDSLAAWVTAVAMNLTRSGFRRLRVEGRARAKLVAVPHDATSQAETRVDVRRALATLSRRQREATVLRYYVGLEVTEIARVMGSPEGTIKSLLARARASLAGSLHLEDSRVANHDDV